MRTILSNQYFTGHRVVLNRIVLYYGSSKKYGHTIGYTGGESGSGGGGGDSRSETLNWLL